ncbi:MAG: lipoyl protein ligase domain-containing protein [Ilumatobacteraceae bacterium]
MFHRDDPLPRRSVTVVEVDRTTLVLGSSQPDDAVDHRVADALGIDVVRRRSGGGAVLLVPGEFVWVDVVIPAGDPLWSDDVGGAMVWLGRAWQAALAAVGVESRVHDGAMQHSPWSRAVCFAGLGTGEVVPAASGSHDRGGKLVGISQRRTRDWARFQTMCHRRWRPEVVSALVHAPRPAAPEVACVAVAVPVDVDRLVAAVLSALPR